MTPAEREAIQQRVDDCYGLFVGAVAKNRNMATATAKSLADGAVHYGQRAIDLGLADRIGTLDETVATVARGSKTAPARRMSMSTEATVTGGVQSETPPAGENNSRRRSSRPNRRLASKSKTASSKFSRFVRRRSGQDRKRRRSFRQLTFRRGFRLIKPKRRFGRELIAERSGIHPVNSPSDGGYALRAR